MQTFLTLGTGDKDPKQLTLYAKKRFETSQDIRLTVKAWLNTVTSSTRIDSSLIKHFRLGSAPVFTEDDVYKPDQRPHAGIGMKMSSLSDDGVLTLTAKQKFRIAKHVDYVRGRQVLTSYTQAQARGNYDYNLRTERWTGEAEVSLSHAMFKFASDQDVRLTAGARWALSPGGVGATKPFVKLEENSWSVTVDGARKFSVAYAL